MADTLLPKKQLLIFFLIWAVWFFQATTGQFFLLVKILGVCLAAIWGVFAINYWIFNNRLNFLCGLYPRSLLGLGGILSCPFLHGDLGHITGNSLAFAIRGGLILMTGIENFFITTITTAFTSGMGVWFFGPGRRPTIGASGITFGYLGFLLVRGYVDREIVPALFSIFSLFFYNDRVWGLMPTRPRMSWQGHLFGFLGGAWTAYRLNDIKAALPPEWLSSGFWSNWF